ncbi:MAG TPA: MFS transporter [Actinocatenispora sp.]
MTTADSTPPVPVRRGAVSPLYAAGFVTAFGAHSIAASLGGYTHHEHASLLTLGILLAVYDGAEIILKPVFGALADRVGPRPVLIGGLVGFALASAAFVAAGDPALVGLARLGQGAAAAAFSPAAGALLARLAPARGHGRAFGSYGAWKGLGYTLGPLAGGALVTVGGYRLLFAVLTVLAGAVCVWAAVTVPAAPPLPRRRYTLADAARAFTRRSFVLPTTALAAASAALATGVGFLPVRGAASGLGPLATGGIVAALAATAAATQPLAGRARDSGRLPDTLGRTAGLVLTAAGFAAAAWLPALAGLPIAALTIGAGTGLITPLAFAALTATTPPERLGTTLGSAEVGREAGDAGGPLLVGALAAGLSLAAGLTGLAVLLAALAATPLLARHRGTPDTDHASP